MAFFASLAAWRAGFACLATVPCGLGVVNCKAVFLKSPICECGTHILGWSAAHGFCGFALLAASWSSAFFEVLLVFLVGSGWVACGALVLVGSPAALASPCILIGLLGSPLCGAALTFFAAA
jgi:hypothetical protein